MQISPNSDFGAEKRLKTRNLIVPPTPATPQQFSEAQQLPPLPPHLDQLLSSHWTKEASLQIDIWSRYAQLEFEGVGNE